ncbi:MAG: hypothetical protein H7A24_07690 [Leptospiraceae bacterium]|nr:hypothetical protein [Leptospiraceae bacterium]MCP5511747.1 hypothetical protein [Leptospiraceae bacterium]
MHCFLTIFLVLFPTLLISQSKYNNKITEFGIFNYAGKRGVSKQMEIPKERVDGQKLGKILSLHPPPKTVKKIDLSKRNVLVGNRGTRVVIPPNAFQYSDFLTAKGFATVHIYEVIDDFDYITVGINQVVVGEDKKQSYFELGGMLKVEVYQGNKKLKMSGEFPMIADFPDIYPGTSFHIYHINGEGSWVKKTDFGSYEVHKPKSEGTGKLVVGSRKMKLTSQGWWGFGLPRSETAAFKGEIKADEGSLSNLQVFALGVGFSSFISKWSSGKNFSINAIPGRQFRIFVADEKGSIGFTQVLESSTQPGLDSLPDSPGNFRKEVPSIELKKISPDIFSDRDRLKAYLGLKTLDFEVDYPD